MSVTEPITWHEHVVNVKDLRDYEHNPRRISRKEFAKLVDSLQEDGYHSRIKVTHENVIIGGHARKKALLAAGFKEIMVLKPNRALTEEEFKRINIRDNLIFGEFDTDILANHFEIPDLLNWGLEEKLLDLNKEMEDMVKDTIKHPKCEYCGK